MGGKDKAKRKYVDDTFKDTWVDRQTDGLTDRQTDRQTDRHTDRQEPVLSKASNQGVNVLVESLNMLQ